MAAIDQFGPEEARRMRARAVARWVLNSRGAGARADGLHVTADLRECHGIVTAAVITVGGEILAEYRVSKRGYMARLPLRPDGAAMTPLSRSQALRGDIAALTAESAARRCRSSQLRARAQAARLRASALQSQLAALGIPGTPPRSGRSRARRPPAGAVIS